MKHVLLIAMIAAVLLVTGTLAQDAGLAKNPDSAAVASTGGTATSAPYVIGPEDTLLVSVWKEPELTATLPVRPDGMISLPLLADVQAAGLTPMQLSVSLRERLRKYVADPRVTVVVTQMNSQRIYVMGEVLHTGVMPLSPNMTVLQALASAGFTQFANTKAIYVLRTENDKQEKIPVNYKSLIKGDSPEHNIFLKPGDTVVVP
jgi:polysaccharide export outer membrane protein